MSNEPVVLVNVLRVEPDRQAELIDVLKHNIDEVASRLSGWRSSRLVASSDGTRVVIYSEWESPAHVEAMRQDPGMKATFPRIMALATFDSMAGHMVHHRTLP